MGAIARAKDSAYEEFLATLNRDPWGWPYRTVRNKMPHAAQIESMLPELLSWMVAGLFAELPPHNPPKMTTLMMEAES